MHPGRFLVSVDPGPINCGICVMNLLTGRVAELTLVNFEIRKLSQTDAAVPLKLIPLLAKYGLHNIEAIVAEAPYCKIYKLYNKLQRILNVIETTCEPIPMIRVQSANIKRFYKFPKASHATHKLNAINYVMAQHSGVYLQFIQQQSKQDDLCDAYLLAEMYYTKWLAIQRRAIGGALAGAAFNCTESPPPQPLESQESLSHDELPDLGHPAPSPALSTSCSSSTCTPQDADRFEDLVV